MCESLDYRVLLAASFAALAALAASAAHGAIADRSGEAR